MAFAIVIAPYVVPPRRESHLARVNPDCRKSRSILAGSRSVQNASRLQRARSAASTPSYADVSPLHRARKVWPFRAFMARLSNSESDMSAGSCGEGQGAVGAVGRGGCLVSVNINGLSSRRSCVEQGA